jgi:hypothetical protein
VSWRETAGYWLSEAAELSEALQVLRRLHVPTTNSVGHVTNVEIAVGVDRHAMRGNKLVWSFALLRGANAGLQLAVQVVDAHTMAKAGSIIHSTYAVELANKEVPLIVQADAVRPMDIVPHGDELPVGIEHLDTMRLAVSNVDSIVPVDNHIMGPDKLASINARLTPRQDMPTIGSEFVDTAVAIAV